MTRSAPLLVTAPNHGVFDQWHVAVVDAKGMTQLYAALWSLYMTLAEARDALLTS